MVNLFYTFVDDERIEIKNETEDEFNSKVASNVVDMDRAENNHWENGILW